MNEEEFLQWLENIDGGRVEQSRVREEWPEFYENEKYQMIGVTMMLGDDGETLVPKRDYRQAVKYGQVLD